jgi:hypothetical protein
LLACALVIAIPTAAANASQNSASTHAFILANYALVHVSEGRIRLFTRRASARMHSLLHECRDAASGSPQNEEAYQLGYEAAGALWSAAYGADAGPIDVFVKAAAGLRWSNSRTQREVKRYVRGLHGLAHLRSPHVCEDIASWKASGYQTVPTVTKSFDAYVESLEATPVPARLLLPYAQPADRALLRRTQQGETKLLNAETLTGSSDWYTLTEGLGLNP